MIKIQNSGFEIWPTPGSPPLGWTLEGTGAASPATQPMNGQFSLQLNGTNGQTWISQSFALNANTYYRVACWMKTSQAGASIALQRTDNAAVLAIASHSGGGQWEYVQAVGLAPASVGARVRLMVLAGVTAYFDNAVVASIPHTVVLS